MEYLEESEFLEENNLDFYSVEDDIFEVVEEFVESKKVNEVAKEEPVESLNLLTLEEFNSFHTKYKVEKQSNKSYSNTDYYEEDDESNLDSHLGMKETVVQRAQANNFFKTFRNRYKIAIIMSFLDISIDYCFINRLTYTQIFPATVRSLLEKIEKLINDSGMRKVKEDIHFTDFFVKTNFSKVLTTFRKNFVGGNLKFGFQKLARYLHDKIPLIFRKNIPYLISNNSDETVCEIEGFKELVVLDTRQKASPLTNITDELLKFNLTTYNNSCSGVNLECKYYLNEHQTEFLKIFMTYLDEKYFLDCNFDTKSFRIMASIMSKTIGLKLRNQGFYDSDMDNLAISFSSAKQLKFLDLSNCFPVLKNFPRYFSSYRFSEHLNNSFLRLKGLNHLKNLTVLFLEKNRINNKVLDFLILQIKGLKNLATLSLADNNITQATTELCSYIEKCNLTKLYFQKNNIEDCVVFAQSLKVNKSINILKIGAGLPETITINKGNKEKCYKALSKNIVNVFDEVFFSYEGEYDFKR